MKKTFTTLGFLAFIFFQSINVFGQEYVKQVYYSQEGQISQITFKEGTEINTIDLKNPKSGNSINKLLKISDNFIFKQYKREENFKDFITDYYSPYINDYPIENSDIKIITKNNKLLSISGNLPLLNDQLNSTINITAKQALDLAINFIDAKTYHWNVKSDEGLNIAQKPEGKLVYIPIESVDGIHVLKLAYKIDIYAVEPLSRDYVYVDASSGLILSKKPIIKQHSASRFKTEPGFSTPKKNVEEYNVALDNGNADTRYSGSREIQTTFTSNNLFELKDTSRNAIIETLNLNNRTTATNLTSFTDNDNNWTAAEFHNAKKDDAALDAHWGVTKTYDYFFTKFNRNSYDNRGSKLLSYIHYGNQVDNAFWNFNHMEYGDGDTEFDALTSLDVTAHELGHAVCDATADLIYNRESGALNEGFSDIWAAIVEHNYTPEKSPFLIGEDISLNQSGFMRSMSNPKASGGPDTYRGINWVAAKTEEGCITPIFELNDYCGVHTNSSIINHWFYILVNGKTGTNDLGNSYQVNGIGWDDAEQIVYLIETAYLNQSSDYLHTRNSAINAAINLFGEHSLQRIAVQDAFYAVGIGGKYRTEPDTNAPTVPLNLTASNTTGNATTLSWEPATDDIGLWGYILYKNNVEFARTNNTEYRVSDLLKNTTYTFHVKAYDYNDNISNNSNQVQVTTTEQAKPCTATGNLPNYFRIGKVKLNTIDHSSSALRGYEDFAYIKTELNVGQPYQITITPDILSVYSHIPLSYAIFLDHNNTGTFGNSKKIAEIAATPGTGDVSTTITIPNTALLDRELRLRIIQIYNYDNTRVTGCDNYAYGQVEDYSIIAKSANLSTTDINNSEFNIYPNPVKDKLFVKNNSNAEFKFEVVNALGAIILKGKTLKQIDVAHLDKGVYILKIEQDGKLSTQKFVKK